MGHFAANCTEEKKDKESVDGNESGANNPNFDEFEDDESCGSGDDHLNLGEFEDQDDVSTDQDVDSIDDTSIENSFAREAVKKYQATLGCALFLTQQSRPDILQAITVLSDASFGTTNLGIQDAYLLMDLGSTLNIPVQEHEGSELDNHSDMPELLFSS